MLEALLHHKEEEKEYLCALVVTEDRVDAALWETSKDGKVSVLKTSQQSLAGEWEKTIDAADSAVTEIESALPEGAELTKVVFGLFPEWLTEDRIKDAYLKKLKQLTSSLSLTPLGFVELPIAVVHLLQKDEGTQQTVVLLGLEAKHLTVSIFKIGKLVKNVTTDRTDQIAVDVEKILVSFTDLEVLPSRILVYGTSNDLEQVKTDLLNFPWQKKANSLHFPKIEVLPNHFPVKAVAVASATEIMPHTESETAEVEVVPTTSTDTTEITEQSSEVTTIAQDLGFVKNADIADAQPETAVTTDAEIEAQAENVANVLPMSTPQMTSTPQKLPSVKLPSFKLPKLTFTLRLPKLPKLGLVVILVLGLLLISGGVAVAYWFLPHATVKILVTPQNLDKTLTITVDEQAESVDADQKVLPGKTVTEEVKGGKDVTTSGKKTVGDKAKGEVTIYNKTLNTKVFKKGTILSAGKLKFTLDEETSIASASEGLGSLTYGTTKTAITSSDIGSAANAAASTEFTFSELPTSSYSARNEKALTGGSSRDIAIVSRDDQSRAREQALAELETQAQTQLKQKLSSEDKLLDNSLTSKVLQETFSKEVGEEADQVTIDMTVISTGIVYKQADFFTLLEGIVNANLPENYIYTKEDAKISVESTQEGKNGIHIFTANIQVPLLPKVATTDMAKKLVGKKISEATEYMKSQGGISGVEFSVNAPLTQLKNSLPINPANITIEISSL